MQADKIASVIQAITAKPVSAAEIALLTAKGISLPVNKSSAQSQPANANSVTISNKPAMTPGQHPNQEKNDKTNRRSASSHVIKEYNAKGELLYKFVDHKNHFIYQIHSEMAASIQTFNNQSFFAREV